MHVCVCACVRIINPMIEDTQRMKMKTEPEPECQTERDNSIGQHCGLEVVIH